MRHPGAQVTSALNGLPTWLKDDVANFGLDVALDLTEQLTRNYTGQYFYDELRGEENRPASPPESRCLLVLTASGPAVHQVLLMAAASTTRPSSASTSSAN